MHRGWRRAAAAVGVALCGVLLAGCDVKGTVVVQADDKLTVDLTLSEANTTCPVSLSPLTLVITPVQPDPVNPGPTVRCRVTGTVTPAQLDRMVSLTTVREYKAAKLVLSSEDIAVDTADVIVRLPGEVLASSAGEIQGDSVRIVEAGDLEGLTIVALNRPGPSDRVIWGAAGAAAGVAGTLLVLGVVWFLRQSRRRPAVADPTDAPAADIDDPEASDDPTAAESAPEWAAPQPPEPASDPAASAPAHDHSIWAPPEDNGEDGG